MTAPAMRATVLVLAGVLLCGARARAGGDELPAEPAAGVAEARLEASAGLEVFGPSYRIQAVTVRLEDVTGPRKAGVDKRCCLDVKLKAPAGQLLIDELGDDIGATFQLALDRLKAAISRKAAKAKRGVGRG